MKNRKFLLLTLIVSLGVFVFWGCPKKAEVSSAPETKKEAAPAATAKEEKAEPVKEEAKPEAKEEAKERAAAGAEGLQPIYFDFDKSFVRQRCKGRHEGKRRLAQGQPEGEGQDRGELRRTRDQGV